ncbi:Pentatricopeptide repeat-containing protein, mitochondrial [Vitis vinifera]|uniref:Pentatricopeptide repeat-containing protein, mitochondrial n=1 Tax=Vitis vinifera TaxID=29760 RepID=A0A438FIX3_VITVI|nr:Pentatricopeptide repeat-containing protein, mitochondrial [Vitis vinifera]
MVRVCIPASHFRIAFICTSSSEDNLHGLVDSDFSVPKVRGCSNDAVLISDAIRNTGDGLGTKPRSRQIGYGHTGLLSCLIGVLPKWTVECALEELGRLKDLGYKPSRLTYNALVRVFLEADRLTQLIWFIEKCLILVLIWMGIHWVACAFAVQSRRWREALALIEKEEFKLDTVIYTQNDIWVDFALWVFEKRQLDRETTLMPIVAQENGRLWLQPAYGEMLDAHVVLNKVNVSNLARCLCGAGKFEKAYSIIREMMSCIPNVVTYTALIDGHCKSGQIEKACQIYARMRGNADIPDVDMYFKIDDGNIRDPNIFTYGALVDGLCKAHKVKKHVIYWMSCQWKVVSQIILFMMLLSMGFASSLIDRLFKDKRLDLALKVLSRMLENSCAPNVIIYTEMIDGLCKVGKTDEAYRLMSMMEEKGCHPNVVTYTAMIDGFGKAGKVDKCLELMRQMGAKGCAPNFVTYRVLINHCCAAGLLDDAHQLLMR